MEELNVDNLNLIVNNQRLWEMFLKKPEFTKDREAWNKLGSRFTKKKLFGIMYNSREKYGKTFDIYDVVPGVVSKIKSIKQINFLNKEDYFRIQKLFRKFTYLFNNPRKLNELKLELEKNKESITKATRENIVSNFENDKIDSMVRPKERDKLDITEIGDVVAPGDRREDDW